MRINKRFYVLSHARTRNVQGGNNHLSAGEPEKMRWLFSNKDKLKEKSSYGLYAQGVTAKSWTQNAITDQKSLGKIPVPEVSKPVQVCTPNEYTFLVRLRNGSTYGYGTAANRFILDCGSINNAATPLKLNITSDWKDISMSVYWATHNPSVAVSSTTGVPYILTSTAKHTRAIREYGSVAVSMQYNSSGYGFTYITSTNSGTVNANAVASGAIIKQVILFLNTAAGFYSLAYTSSGIYAISCSRTSYNGSALISFPYGTIKNAWLINASTMIVQDKNNVVYKLSISGSKGNTTWIALGEWDVKDIPCSYSSCCRMLTNDGKVYWHGSEYAGYGCPESSNTFTQIHENYRFESICNSLSNFMGIGWKVA